MISRNTGYRTKQEVDMIFANAISKGKSIENELSKMHQRQQANLLPNKLNSALNLDGDRGLLGK